MFMTEDEVLMVYKE